MVKRPAISFINGVSAAISALLPPAITVRVPVPDAGGPPDTGASIHPQPVSLSRRTAKAFPSRP
jgi:hypothetical protein